MVLWNRKKLKNKLRVVNIAVHALGGSLFIDLMLLIFWGIPAVIVELFHTIFNPATSGLKIADDTVSFTVRGHTVSLESITTMDRTPCVQVSGLRSWSGENALSKMLRKNFQLEVNFPVGTVCLLSAIDDESDMVEYKQPFKTEFVRRLALALRWKLWFHGRLLAPKPARY